MRRTLVLLAVLFCASPGAVAADDHGVLLRRAEIAERSLGDLVAAAELYQQAAAAAGGVADRARAEIRAAGCLARSGDTGKALLLARPWLTPADADAVPDEVVLLAKAVVRDLDVAHPPVETEGAQSPVPTADPETLRELEHEAEQLRLRLEQAIKAEKGAREDLDDLAIELRGKDEEIKRLKSELPPGDLRPEEYLALRRREVAEQRRKEQRDSLINSNLARLLHREGRFAEARSALYRALEADPENAEAKLLLGRVAAPFGDREQLYLRVREILALAQEVRAARVTAEAETLVSRARRALDDSDPTTAAPLLERALALVDTEEASRRAPASLRDEILRGLRRTGAAGVPRAPQAPPPPSALTARWSQALLAILEEAGTEVAGGLGLRFHDLAPAMPSARPALPPVPLSAPTRGWTVRASGMKPAPLVAEWLIGDERAALSSEEAAADLVGRTLVVVAPAATHTRLGSRLTRAAVAGLRSAEVEIAVLREPPSELLDRLRADGIETFAIAGGGEGAVIPATDVADLLGEDGDLPGETLGRATFRATHLRPFRLTTREGSRVLALDVLAVASDPPGAAVALTTEWNPRALSTTSPLRASVSAGATLARGGALLVTGLLDPADASESFTALVRVGRAEGLAPLPTPELGGETPPEAPAGMRFAEHRIPHAVASLDELGEPLLLAAGDPFPARETALLALLREVAVNAASVELRGDRVRVVGPDEAHSLVETFLKRIAATRGLQTLGVAVHSLNATDAAQLVRLVPTLGRSGTGVVAHTVVSDRSRQGAIDRLLASRGRRIPLVQNRLAAPPTGRDHVGHVVRYPYRSELDSRPGDPEAWGRAESLVVETGLAVAMRAFGRTVRGRHSLQLHVRSVRLRDSGVHERDTPLGEVPILAPEVEGIAETLHVVAAPRDVIVLVTRYDPFAASDDGLLVVVLRPAD